MNLQNITLYLTDNKVFSYYEDIIYTIPSITNMATLQTELDAQSGISVENAVVQYTIDQYGQGAEPRIVFNDGSFVALDSISAELTAALLVTRGEVETEITAQLP